MIWQNPWAWLGLLTLVVPLLVHLLTRRTARVLPFPTLRFLATSAVRATHRTRLSDLILLMVRCTVLAAAVAALAQPYVLTAGRNSSRARTITRAIVVDTSASMRRTSESGDPALEAARRSAAEAAAASGAHIMVETASLRSALPGAAAWLATRSGRHELHVFSDFQRGALDDTDIASMPAHVGIMLHRVPVRADTNVIEHVTPQGDAELVARIALNDDGTSVEWSRRSAHTPRDQGLAWIGADSTTITRSLRAAQRYGAAGIDPARPITLLLGNAEDRDSLMNVTSALSTPWMSDVVIDLVRDPIFVSLTSRDHVRSAPAVAQTADAGTSWLTVAQSSSGGPLLRAAGARIADSDRLLLHAHLDDDEGAAIAALLVAAGNATATTPAASELEPRTIADSALGRWQRAATAPPRAASAGDESDGRWLWLLALALLGVEAWLRRRARSLP